MVSVPSPHPTSRTFFPRHRSNSANSGICGSTKYFRCSTSSKYSFVPTSLVEWRILQGRSSQYFFTADTGNFSKSSVPDTFIPACQKYSGGVGHACSVRADLQSALVVGDNSRGCNVVSTLTSP